MAKQSFLDKITGKKTSADETVTPAEPAPENQEVVDGEVDHLWMKEDLDAEKPKLEKDPRIDTGILRDRIANKIAKMNSH